METWDEMRNRIEFGERAGTKLEGEAASVSGRREEVKSAVLTEVAAAAVILAAFKHESSWLKARRPS